MGRRTRLRHIALGTVLLLITAACGKADEEISTGGDPLATLRAAAEATAEITTYTFDVKLEVEGWQAERDPCKYYGGEQYRVSGAVDRDALRGWYGDPGDGDQPDVIIIDDSSWLRSKGSWGEPEGWLNLNEFPWEITSWTADRYGVYLLMPGDFFRANGKSFGPDFISLFFEGAISSATLVGTEEVGGDAAQRYSFDIDLRSLFLGEEVLTDKGSSADDEPDPSSASTSSAPDAVDDPFASVARPVADVWIVDGVIRRLLMKVESLDMTSLYAGSEVLDSTVSTTTAPDGPALRYMIDVTYPTIGEPVDVTAPPADEVLDPAELEGAVLPPAWPGCEPVPIEVDPVGPDGEFPPSTSIPEDVTAEPVPTVEVPLTSTSPPSTTEASPSTSASTSLSTTSSSTIFTTSTSSGATSTTFPMPSTTSTP